MRVRLKRSGEKVCLVVADDGRGMDEDAAPASSSMGLHIVRALAEHTLGGTLTIRRREGTKVSVRFTVAPEDGGAQEPQARPPLEQRDRRSRQVVSRAGRAASETPSPRMIPLTAPTAPAPAGSAASARRGRR